MLELQAHQFNDSGTAHDYSAKLSYLLDIPVYPCSVIYEHSVTVTFDYKGNPRTIRRGVKTI